MTVNIENEVNCSFPFDYEKLIRSVCQAALEEEGCPYEASVDIVLTDDAAIQEVNREMRSIDRSTDVLSFPTAFYQAPAGFDVLEDQDDCFDPDSGEYLLGDMMISIDHVKAQAVLYNHSQKRELAFLVAHSMLHLMGYDHENDQERLVMEEKQEEILQSLGLTREIKDEDE